MGRSLGQAVDVLLGRPRRRTPLRFAFEIMPQLVVDLPDGVTAASIVWEKGSLVSYTEPAKVRSDTKAATFENVLMRQTATIYKHANALLPKFYTFKVQSVQQVAPSSSSDSSRISTASAQPATLSGRRKTIARAKLDLAQFCSAESAGPTAATKAQVPLEPQGTLHLTVKTVWLQNYDQAKSAQLLQQASGRAAAQPWGSVSDVESYTDRSSVSSSIFGSYLCETERNTCSGSAELDRLLQEAEAATAAKTVPANSKAASTGCLALKPRVITLDTLSTATATAAGPRGPSRQHPRTASMGPLGLIGRSSPPQHAGQAALDVLGRRSHQPCRHASPFGSVTLSALEGSCSCSSSGSHGRADSPGVLAGNRRWHRRASSVPETPPILEADREGMDTTSFTAAIGASAGGGANPSACAQLQQQARGPVGIVNTDVTAEDALPFGMRPSSAASAAATDQEYSDEEDETAAWMDVCSSATAAALQLDSVTSGHSLQDSSRDSSQQRKGVSDGPEALRSLSGRMPTWLWPSSRLAVRDLTTDEIMRRISGSKDITSLQHMCRGLLCERNDWRFRATQAERVNTNLQQELHELRTAESEAQQQLQQQLSEGQLVHKLVDAKLQLAQADLSMQDLKRQLERERKRHMQALAKLTSLQDNFDRYIHEHQGAGGDCCKPVGCYV